MDSAVRAELRCPDPSSNPYLTFIAILAAGLDGIEKGMTPPAPLNNINVYELTKADRKRLKVTELPGSLREAMVELDKDKVIKDALGPMLYEAFVRSRMAEWEEYRINVTDWEVEHYLETA
jgi:glutamine synthetase